MPLPPALLNVILPSSATAKGVIDVASTAESPIRVARTTAQEPQVWSSAARPQAKLSPESKTGNGQQFSIHA